VVANEREGPGGELHAPIVIEPLDRSEQLQEDVLRDVLVVRPVARSEKAVDRRQDGSVQVANDGPRCFLVAGLGQANRCAETIGT